MSEIKKLLNNIQVNLDAPKSQYNKQYDYNYRNAEDILNGVKKLIGEGSIILKDEPIFFGEELLLMKSTAILMLGDETIENPAYVEIPRDLARMSAPQKWTAISSYCRKMALTGLFACNDEKDLDRLNDNNSKKQSNSYNNSKKQGNSESNRQKTEITEAESKRVILRNIISKFTDKFSNKAILSAIGSDIGIKNMKQIPDESLERLNWMIEVLSTNQQKYLDMQDVRDRSRENLGNKESSNVSAPVNF